MTIKAELYGSLCAQAIALCRPDVTAAVYQSASDSAYDYARMAAHEAIADDYISSLRHNLYKARASNARAAADWGPTWRHRGD